MSLYFHHFEKLFDQIFCQNIINKFSFDDYEKANVEVYGVKKKLNNIRNNYRIEFTSLEIAAQIHDAISSTASPPLINNKKYYAPSSNFRIYLYEKENYFKPHRDGTETVGDAESCLTCLIYLNDTKGGETVLMPKGFSDKSTHITIAPQMGDMLLFDHKIWHEAKPVISGEKLVLRTNLLYKN